MRGVMTASVRAASFVAPLGALGKLVARGREAAAQASAAEKKAAFEPFRRAFVSTMRTLHRPRACVVFCSGGAEIMNLLAVAVSQSPYRHVPTMFVSASSVLSEAGEFDGGAAATGACWGAGNASLSIGATLGDALGAQPSGGHLALFSSEDLDPNDLTASTKGRRAIFGAGTDGPVVLADDGRVESAPAGVIRFDDAFSPVVESSSACAIVSDPFTVTEADATFILRLEDAPALEVLTEQTSSGKHRGLVMLKVEHEDFPESIDLRPIRGIDPGRKAIALKGAVRAGSRIRFAVRDANTARTSLDESLRRIEERARGSQPMLGLYLSCAGRQRALYGESDTEVRAIRKRFPKLPFAGAFTPLQLVQNDRVEPQQMASTLALFRAPS